ncbi:hypothetical protein L914_18570, partial [Phytophthora nicotianae]
MRGSKRSGCPMRIALHAVSKTDTEGLWKIAPCCSQVPGTTVGDHTSDLVEIQTAAGVAVSTIQATLLSADRGSLVIAKDIANTKSAVRRRDLASHTAIEALFVELRKHNFFHKWRFNPETIKLTHLILAHPDTTELFKLHHDVLVADCTYKTNKHRIPLLNIIV